MPCMCGDTHCRSCGPAQGNNRCEVCGAWDDDGGCSDPEACKKRIKEIQESERISAARECSCVHDEQGGRLHTDEDCPLHGG